MNCERDMMLLVLFWFLRIWNYLVEIARSGVSIIITTHYIEEARQGLPARFSIFLICNNLFLILPFEFT